MVKFRVTKDYTFNLLLNIKNLLKAFLEGIIMVDFTNKHLATIEDFLAESIKQSAILSEEDLDSKEIVFQLSEEVRLKQFRWSDSSIVCVPNVVRIVLPETKASKVEEIEMLFAAPAFTKTLTDYLESSKFHLVLPIRTEVELVSKGSSRLIYSAGRCLLALDWPLPEEAENFNVVIDDIKKKVLEVQERKPQIPLIGRLTSLNADVYQNNYFLTKEITYIGRLRTVRDDQTGQFLRKNDFVFSQLEDPEAIGNSVSRQHAKIEFRDNSFVLVDQGSANSTVIERREQGAPITAIVTGASGAKLQDGDIIILGSARLRFNIVESIDKNVFVLQQGQDLIAKKLERGLPKQTFKISAIYLPEELKNELDKNKS